MISVNTKNDIYQKYANNPLAKGLFTYILTEYHDQPDEFLRHYTSYQTAEDVLDEAFKRTSLDDAKFVIDDFFRDIMKEKNKGRYYGM